MPNRTIRVSFRYGLACVIPLCGLPLALSAQQQNSQISSFIVSPPRDAAAVRILDNAFDSMASAAVRQGIHSVVIKGIVDSPGNPAEQVGTFTARFVASHFLLDTVINGHETRYSAFGRHGQVKVDGKTTAVTTSGSSDLGADIFPLLEPWSNYSQSEIGIKSVAEEQSISAVTCVEVDVERQLGFPMFGHATDDVRIFISKDSGRLRAVDYAMNQTRVYSPSKRMRVLYDDYTAINGLNVPTTITRIIDGHISTILRITTIDTSQSFDDASLGL